MPKITINEVDLTKASLQPSATDIAFVPGFSCLATFPEAPTLCESIADFEKNFGTYPAITGMYRRYVYRVDQIDDSDNITAYKGEACGYKKYRVKLPDVFKDKFYTEIVKNTVYKSGVPTPYSSGSLSGTTQVVLAVPETQSEDSVDGWLADSGLMLDTQEMPVSREVKTSYFDFEYDMSYVYAKELIRAGVPVIYFVAKNLVELNDTKTAFKNNSTYVDLLSYIASSFEEDGTHSVNIPDGILDKGEYSIKYVTSGAYPSVVFYKYNNPTTAENFSAEATYDIGDYVMHNDEMYECVVAVTTAGSWNSTNWKEVIPGTGFQLEKTGASQFCSDLLNISGKRGDSVSLIDMGDSTLFESSMDENKVRKYEQEQMLDPAYLWGAVTSDAFISACPDYAEYGALFAPWALYTTQSSYYVEGGSYRTELPQLSSVIMPPSFGYLISLAKSIIINNNWVAVAGVARGQVPSINGLYTVSRLSNSLANAWQPRNGKISVNPITNIKPYGLTIWGNRTMKNNMAAANGGEDGLTATSFLNIRNMVSDVKKTAYIAAKTLMFEQNSDVLWVNFLSRVAPLLDKLMSGQGLSDYKIIKNPTNEKAKLKATIKLFPIYAVEDFEITIELSDEDVSVV